LLDIQKGHVTYSATSRKNVAAPAQRGVAHASMERIAKLKDQGILTEEEAAKMRADVLSGI